jgi:peptide/nickel transport system permease protein
VMAIGVTLGATAGYFRGWIDTIISRVTEVTMAFPALLFIIALAATVGPRLDTVTLGIFGKGVITLVLIFTIFGWFYPARIMRAQVLSIREKEYIEAARMIGASDARIIRSHVLPHLIAPMIVYSTLIVASYVLFEAGLSFLGLGIKPPTASWGNLLSDAPQYYTTRPLLMLWPGLALLLATLAFNLLGDGLRDAFDPRSSR